MSQLFMIVTGLSQRKRSQKLEKHMISKLNIRLRVAGQAVDVFDIDKVQKDKRPEKCTIPSAIPFLIGWYGLIWVSILGKNNPN